MLESPLQKLANFVTERGNYSLQRQTPDCDVAAASWKAAGECNNKERNVIRLSY